MADLVEMFREAVLRERLFTKADKLLLACSGGLDSTVLAHLLRAEGYDYAIVHVNFQLRGAASDEDAAFVEELARAQDAKFFGTAVDVEAAALPGESTQMTARRLRYSYFKKILDEYKYDLVLTAHHADDNFETFLLHLLRGSGLTGLAGMQPRRDRLVRPLLSVSRAELLAYAGMHGIRWREDGSNAQDDYLRNRIRHTLVPVFTEGFGLSPGSWARTAEQLRGEQLFLAEALARAAAAGAGQLIRRQDYPVAAQLLTLLHHLHPGFSAEQHRQMVMATRPLVLRGEETTAYVTREGLQFLANADLDAPLALPLEVQALPFTYQHPLLSLRLEQVLRPEELRLADGLYLAPSSFPLHLRTRQKGDYFAPFGLAGKRTKLKEYLIDRKVPAWLRDRLPLLVDAEDKILAVPTAGIAEGCGVDPQDAWVWRLSWKMTYPA
ncbi:tRNA lysidine(34) synthetase TilS [Neolewinella lacunae]|uniref:tRNA(Ile)-lysidine synthase n=1 Tax=Neolewinella lacunae TaxID=1517758 RepID=A0A923TC90_9BACT|nr:tRNA lysidine(34) synthetase TilS [Neolewinella lacunae]MBC6993462.1 tRNA lysidine(34) synthetase TilS [Neolewinella lacunae]MDN3636262.1 tRNA lysidine(34) synthetase TilS [Neolewinella lacunae]